MKFDVGEKVWVIGRSVVCQTCPHCGQELFERKPDSVRYGTVTSVSAETFREPLYGVEFESGEVASFSECWLYRSAYYAGKFLEEFFTERTSLGTYEPTIEKASENKGPA